MTRHISLFSMCLIAGMLFSCGSATAALVFQPPGLSPGDEYRLVFVTSTTRDAESENISDYNAFVQAAADASPLAVWGLDWAAIASTEDIDAHDNTETNPATDGPNVPVYLVDGTNIADSYPDLWDDSIDAPINWTEMDTLYEGLVWTGTDEFGIKDNPSWLGANEPTYGFSSAVDGDWIEDDTLDADRALPFYAISDVIVAVPEPTTAALMLLFFACSAFPRRNRY